jgi:hypothetical protein
MADNIPSITPATRVRIPLVTFLALIIFICAVVYSTAMKIADIEARLKNIEQTLDRIEAKK